MKTVQDSTRSPIVFTRMLLAFMSYAMPQSQCYVSIFYVRKSFNTAIIVLF